MKTKVRLLVVAAIAMGVTTTVKMVTSQAKSIVRVTSNRYLPELPGTKRNVIPTGKNALYNIAGTLRGAKKLATVTTMKKLRTARTSAKYFRVYKMATTSRKSVYYKVVSFDQKYRGWIYGGKTKQLFAGGIKRTSTTMSIATPAGAGWGGSEYRYRSGQSVWNYPKNAQYQAKRILKSTTNYRSDDLRITNAVMMKREKTAYYYVRNLTNPQLSGWIKASGVVKNSSDTTTPQPENPKPTPTPEPVPTPQPRKVSIQYRSLSYKPVYVGNGKAEYQLSYDGVKDVGPQIEVDVTKADEQAYQAKINRALVGNVPAGYNMVQSAGDLTEHNQSPYLTNQSLVNGVVNNLVRDDQNNLTNDYVLTWYVKPAKPWSEALVNPTKLVYRDIKTDAEKGTAHFSWNSNELSNEYFMELESQTTNNMPNGYRLLSTQDFDDPEEWVKKANEELLKAKPNGSVIIYVVARE